MSNAKFKHSGIEWLGEIPKHWEAWRLRDIFEIKNGYTPSKANQEFWENGTLPWFRMDDIMAYFLQILLLLPQRQPLANTPL